MTAPISILTAQAQYTVEFESVREGAELVDVSNLGLPAWAGVGRREQGLSSSTPQLGKIDRAHRGMCERWARRPGQLCTMSP